jgi:hypothetical protein
MLMFSRKSSADRRDWPPGANELLGCLDGRPRSRAELVDRARIAPEDWLVAIRFLVDHGEAVRTGEKRGTRYHSAAAGIPCPEVLPTPTEQEPRDQDGPPRLRGTSKDQRIPERGKRWPRVAAVLHASLDDKPRSRGELVERSGLELRHWLTAIQFLVDRGEAIRMGDRATARYCVSGSLRSVTSVVRSDARETTPVDAQISRSTVATGYHDLVSEALRELDAVPNSLKTPQLGPAHVPTSLIELLADSGNVEIIDHRPKGGCLWIIDSPNVGDLVKAIAREKAIKFYRSSGARSTGGRPAWWTGYRD